MSMWIANEFVQKMKMGNTLEAGTGRKQIVSFGSNVDEKAEELFKEILQFKQADTRRRHIRILILPVESALEYFGTICY